MSGPACTPLLTLLLCVCLSVSQNKEEPHEVLPPFYEEQRGQQVVHKRLLSDEGAKQQEFGLALMLGKDPEKPVADIPEIQDYAAPQAGNKTAEAVEEAWPQEW